MTVDLALHDDDGAPCGALTLTAMGEVEWAVRCAMSAHAAASEASATRAFAAALEQARASGARVVETRVCVRDAESEAALVARRAVRVRAALEALGFRHTGDRAEFRLALDEPGLASWLDERARRDGFRWEELSPAGPLSLERAAAAMQRCAAGDPEGSSDDDALGFLRACMADESFVPAPGVVQVGSLEVHADGAFVMTQVRRQTLRARVTYLGLAPELRGRRLGTIVHARGLAMARAQGATSYQGGTSTENAPMRGLLRALGAHEVLALERWVHAR